MRGERIEHARGASRQAGVYSSAFAVTIVLLLFFVGLGLDAGRLYVAKTELQNAADACALAAASALTGGSTNQLEIGELAGVTTGTRNRVLFQNEAVEVPNDAVTFSATLHGTYEPRGAIGSSEARNMKYARCTLTETGIRPWMVSVANALPGVDIGDSVVVATAVATLDPSITACAMPLAVCKKGPGPDFGLTLGEWLQGRLKPGEALHGGTYKWVSFPDYEKVPDLEALLKGSGQCSLQDVETVESQPGVINSLVEAWNGRFGVYKGSGSPASMPPDYSGYSYSPHEFPDGKPNANGNWDGSTGNAFPDFVDRRGANTPWNDVPQLKGGWKGITSTQHAAGADRRLMVGPIVDCDQLETGGPTLVEGWACMMMLSPVANPNDWMMLEYRGLAGAPGSGCATSGLPGGGPGAPKVPGLVL